LQVTTVINIFSISTVIIYNIMILKGL